MMMSEHSSAFSKPNEKKSSRGQSSPRQDGWTMSIKEKLRFMAEMERRNNARWKEFAKKEGEEHACVQVLLHEQQPACAAYAS